MAVKKETTTLRIKKSLHKEIVKLANKGGYKIEAMAAKLISDGIKVNS